ncbi:hypothetical protein [Amycolatopsis kentuckyensis]|uniref:hypothetical protein n=1 Tax=Amycolatopsis kentuckyensis TaxID=218823 RepID=UPI001FC97C14|nr:hypothetical protein [Amycolatopsis kentuckyensis]
MALLRSWGPGPQHLTGLALAGITLQSRLGPRRVDALVFTRCGVVVIAAHEPGPAEWPGPGDRTGAAVAAARGALAGHEGGRHVTGLVAVVPPAQSRGNGPASAEQQLRLGEWAAVRQAGAPEADGRAAESSRAGGPELNGQPRGTESAEGLPRGGSAAPQAGGPPLNGLARGAEPPEGPQTGEPEAPAGGPLGVQQPSEPELPGHEFTPPALRWPDPHPVPGVAVVLAEPRGLRRIIAQHNRWRTVWSADDVLDACYALSLAHLAPPRAALIADGFPARLPVLDRLPDLPAVIPLPPEPPPAAAEDDSVPWTPSARGAVFPRQRPIRQIPWGLLFVLTVLVAVGVMAAVFVAQVFHGS